MHDNGDDGLAGPALVGFLDQAEADLEQAGTELHPALARELDIRLTRLRARALYAQGDLTQALALRDITTCSLEQRALGEDDFFEYDVPWLVEAGRYDEAGQRVAMYLALFALSDAQIDVVRSLIDQRLADPADQSVWWPLCVMRICAYGADLLEVYFPDLTTLPSHSLTHNRLFGAFSREPDLTKAARIVFAAAHQLAEERSPGHPWIERFTILVDYERGLIDDAQVAARFEALVAAGLTEGTTLSRWVMARVAAFGLTTGLSISLPPMPSGADAMRFTSITNDGEPFNRLEATPVGLADLVEQCPDENRQVAQAMWHAMYTTSLRQGIARMEQFFASGVGNPGDANPHYYARLCCDLAVAICDDERFDEAIALCQKGLAASPGARLPATILYIINAQCATPHVWDALDGPTQAGWRRYYVDNAGSLWRFFVAQESYDHFGPNLWIYKTAAHLHYLGRHDEIPLWLERLIRWQEDTAGVSPDQLDRHSLYARVRCLQYMSYAAAQATVCREMIEALKQQLTASSDIELLAVAGVVFGNVGCFDDAIFFYQRHLQLNPRATEDDRQWAADISRNLEDCRVRLVGASQPDAGRGTA